MAGKPRYPQEFKDSLVERVRSGEKVVDVAREAGIPRETLGVWLKAAGVRARRSGYKVERKSPAPEKGAAEGNAGKPGKKEFHHWSKVKGRADEESKAKAMKKKGRPLKFRLYALEGGRFTLRLGDTRIGGEKGIGDAERGRLALEFDVLPDVFNAALRREQA